MFSFTTAAKTAVAGVAIAAAIALPLAGASAAFAGDATFPPTANNDHYFADQDTQLFIGAATGLLSNDSDGGNFGLVVNGVTAGIGGSMVASLDGSFVFTPDAGFVGQVHLIYSDVAGNMASNFADIYIDVAAAPAPLPVANPDFYSTPQDTLLVVDVAAGLLANDTSAQSVFFQDNTTGQMSMNAAGDFTYLPVAGFVGILTFNYQMVDAYQHVSNSAVVTIEVTGTTSSTVPNPGNPGGGNPGNPGDPGDGTGTGSDLPTLAYTGSGDVAAWLVAPALALLTLGGASIWLARRRRALEN